MKKLSSRQATVLVLRAVLEQRQSLEQAFHLVDDHKDLSFIKALSFTTLRWHGVLDAILDVLLTHTPRARLHPAVYALLLSGLAQLRYLDTPDYAALSETVTTAKKMKLHWASKLINAVLRAYGRQHQTLHLSSDVLYSHPSWLLEALKEYWPQDWQTICRANNAPPPCTARINIRQISAESYYQQLETLAISYDVPAVANSVTFKEPKPVMQLPGFKDGHISIQDSAAQFAAHLLQPTADDKVLDACAAPGGKSCHILELSPKTQLLALDHQAARLAKITENQQRLKLSFPTQAVDARQLSCWWDGTYFDKILLDAPCSATGVIRRHPEIKYLRCIADIDDILPIQADLLSILWRTLKPGGLFLYATCSLLPPENDSQIEAFLQNTPDAKSGFIHLPVGRATSYGWQILPGEGECDGFYYALLTKKSIQC